VSQNRITAADGLRGLAAVNVTIHHFLGAFLPALMYRDAHPASAEALLKATNSAWWFTILDFPLTSILYNGHFPVLIFFVLSGYVLAAPYYNDNDQALRDRFWGRYIRLNAPILAALVLSFCFYRFGFYFNQKVSALTGDPWFAGFFQNPISLLEAVKMAFYKTILFGDDRLDAPAWSIRVEFIASIFLLVFYLAKPKRLLFPGLMFAACLLLLLGEQGVNALLLFLGAFLHELPKLSRNKFVVTIIGTFGIYFGCYKFSSAFYDYLPTIFEQNKNLYDAIGALCLTYAVLNGYGAKILEARFAQYLGNISYSLYLTHFILLCSVFSYAFVVFASGPLSILVIFLTYIPIIFLFAQLFTTFVDQPSTRLSRRFAKYIRG
jgi:peptidoglycan/LPS O-acetylase OafA/YrhL